MSQGGASPVMLNNGSRTNSHDSAADGLRKRVGKACDRCRLKKSKCNGSHPCSRCKADNAICVFGERKRSHDKVYPKGYVEMLEQQQGQLVAGLQDMYSRLRAADAWSGPLLAESSGHPLTHDILAALNLLEQKPDGAGEMEYFEDNPQVLQQRLLAEGATFVRRRGSCSSESENSQHEQQARGIQRSNRPSMPSIGEKSAATMTSISPRSPLSPRQQPLQEVPRQQHTSFMQAQPSPLQQQNDPIIFEPTWMPPDMSTHMRSKFGIQTSEPETQFPDMDNMFDDVQFNDLSTFSDFNGQPHAGVYAPNMAGVYDNGMDFGLDPTDLELGKFVTVP